MSKRSKNGSTAQTDLNQFQKTHLRALAFTLTAYDLALAEVVEIVGNSQLTTDGPTGVIVFIANATVDENDMIEFPLTKESGIANAEQKAGVEHAPV
jgi:hypothetical protein